MMGFIRRLFSDARGAVAIEFAFVLPVLIIMYAGGTYLGALVNVTKKVQQFTYDLANLTPYPREIALYNCFKQRVENGFGRELLRQALFPLPIDHGYSIMLTERASSAPSFVAGAGTMREAQVVVTYDFIQGAGLTGLLPTVIRDLVRIRASSPYVSLMQGDSLADCPVGHLELVTDLHSGTKPDPDAPVYFAATYGDSTSFELVASGGSGNYRYYTQHALLPGITLDPNGTVRMVDVNSLSEADQLVHAYTAVFGRLPEVVGFNYWKKRLEEENLGWHALVSAMLSSPEYNGGSYPGQLVNTVKFEVRDTAGDTDYVTVAFVIDLI